jgi:hypothetical protein
LGFFYSIFHFDLLVFQMNSKVDLKQAAFQLNP